MRLLKRDPPESTNQVGVTDKKPYTAPKLSVYGDVEEITKQFGTVNKDMLGGSLVE